MALHSMVIPVYNEFDGLFKLEERLTALAGKMSPDTVEIILVNDGSKDGSLARMEEIAKRNAIYKVIDLSRNFGHQIAITAGIEWARGDTVTVMDADLQDPPEVVLDLLTKWREGFEVVFAVRRKRDGESWFKLATAKFFYRLLRVLTHIDIPVDTGDFRLMDRRAVDALKQMGERNRFVRGMVSWVGFKQTGVLYDRHERTWGNTHYPLKKMIRFAFDGITSFSSFPLRIAFYMGCIASAVSFLMGLYIVYGKFVHGRLVPGWTSMMLVVLVMGGIQLLCIGVMGEYVGRTYEEVKRRPLFLVNKAIGFER